MLPLTLLNFISTELLSLPLVFLVESDGNRTGQTSVIQNKHMENLLLVFAMFTLGITSPAFSQILEYKFNDAVNGTTSVSTGSTTTAVTFQNASNVATDLHGAAGSGVSGQAGDLAFDNTASTGMGTGTGGYANGGDINAIDSLTSFTVQGWFYTSISGTVSGARLMEKNQNANNNVSLQYNRNGSAGSLALTLGTTTMSSTAAFSSTDATLATLNGWVFFAVTYDGTLTSNNVNFYTGTTAAAVTQIGTSGTLNGGTLGTNTGSMKLGNLNGNTKPWDGYLDDIRVYGATSGNGGVLTLSQLDTLRAADAVPEPATWALLAFSLTTVMILRRRRA
jgi:hypothetical protein